MKKNRSRSAASFRRRAKEAEPRQSILIVCEGEKTEPFYFDSLRADLRLTSLETLIHGKQCGTDPLSIVDYAIRKSRERSLSEIRAGFDHVWCVFDTEVPTRKRTAEAINKANSAGINVALSNPCFEYWYILHFRYTASPMQSSDKCRLKLKQLMPKYTKGDRQIYDQLKSKTDNAVINADRVTKERYNGTITVTCNPSTQVSQLVILLREVATT